MPHAEGRRAGEGGAERRRADTSCSSSLPTRGSPAGPRPGRLRRRALTCDAGARVVLTAAPHTRVRRGRRRIGGEAGNRRGRLARDARRRHQVLCVTHLAQVAAFADTQVAVVRRESGQEKSGARRTAPSPSAPWPGRRCSRATPASPSSRACSRAPARRPARGYAAELLAGAARSPRAGGRADGVVPAPPAPRCEPVDGFARATAAPKTSSAASSPATWR